MCFGTRRAGALLFLSTALFAQPERISPAMPRATPPGPHGLAAISIEPAGDVVRRGARQIQIDLPGGESVIAELARHTPRGARNGHWHGRLVFEPSSDVSLTWHDGVLAGAIRRSNAVYEIRPAQAGSIVERLNMASFPPCAGAREPRRNFAADSLAPAAAADGVDEITLLSVYTPQARDAAGGVAQITAQIQAAVDNANAAFVNSQVSAQYTLVHVALANYNDTGNPSADLDWISTNATVAALRDQYNADMVSMIVANGGTGCGIGFVMRNVGAGFADSAFQVTDRDCAVGNLTFAHEHGHNAGLEHDPANGPAPSSASYPWSFGHYVNAQFRTVMSYSSPCPSGCTRVAYFSNPSVFYLGYATGIAEQRDNARTLRLTTPVVAGFRGGALATPPQAPSLLAAVAVSSSQIDLAWVDNASDESGFRVERSIGGGAFAEIAVLGANVTAWSNTGLAANTNYAYRVRATNGAGSSAYTNTAQALTPSGPPIAPVSLSGAPTYSGSGRNRQLQGINLSWTDSSNNETSFELQRCLLQGKGSNLTCVFETIGYPAAGATALADPVTVKGSYRYQIRSRNALGVSAWTQTQVSAN